MVKNLKLLLGNTGTGNGHKIFRLYENLQNMLFSPEIDFKWEIGDVYT